MLKESTISKGESFLFKNVTKVIPLDEIRIKIRLVRQIKIRLRTELLLIVANESFFFFCSNDNESYYYNLNLLLQPGGTQLLQLLVIIQSLSKKIRRDKN